MKKSPNMDKIATAAGVEALNSHTPTLAPVNDLHPGMILVKEFIEPKGWTLAKLAKKLKIPLEEVEAFASGKGDLTDELILGLSQIFKTSVQFWKNLQSRYDEGWMLNLGRLHLSRRHRIYEQRSTWRKRFPWMKWLPENECKAFVREFIEALQQGPLECESDRLEELVHAWKSTARIYSDPELASELKSPLSGKTQRVPRPRRAEENATIGVTLCKWLRMPNSQLNGKTPLEVLIAGDLQVAADFIDDLLTGALT